MLTCRDVADFLMSYIDGELPFGQRLSFRLHLVLCPPCRRYMTQYRRTVALGRDAFRDEDPDGPVPSDVPEELVEAILNARK